MKQLKTYLADGPRTELIRVTNSNNKNNSMLEVEDSVLFLVLDKDDTLNTAFKDEKRMLLEYDIYQPFPPTKCVYRIDHANNAVGQQEHLHVYADKNHKHQLYAINIDGTPHDGSKFQLNRKHQQALKNLGFPVPKEGLLEWLYLGDCRLLND